MLSGSYRVVACRSEVAGDLEADIIAVSNWICSGTTTHDCDLNGDVALGGVGTNTSVGANKLCTENHFAPCCQFCCGSTLPLLTADSEWAV